MTKRGFLPPTGKDCYEGVVASDATSQFVREFFETASEQRIGSCVGCAMQYRFVQTPTTAVLEEPEKLGVSI